MEGGERRQDQRLLDNSVITGITLVEYLEDIVLSNNGEFNREAYHRSGSTETFPSRSAATMLSQRDLIRNIIQDALDIVEEEEDDDDFAFFARRDGCPSFNREPRNNHVLVTRPSSWEPSLGRRMNQYANNGEGNQ